MGLSLPHLIVLALVVLLLFGRGKISELMGDFGKGIKSFKQGINDEAAPHAVAPPPQIAAQPIAPQQPTLNGEPVPEQQVVR
ncbi:MAG: twin-arginine translocase TatA/TatE family subunit [Novosphingobium sp.]